MSAKSETAVVPALDNPAPAERIGANQLGTQTVEPADGKRRGAAGKVGFVVLLLLGASLSWHVATDLMVPSSATGSVSALTALVAPRVAGQVAEVLVADNEYIEAGTPLFTLDSAPFDLAVRQAQANLDLAIQTADASVISLATVEARLQQAKTTLESTRVTTERAQTMFDRGLSSQAQLDAATGQLASAEAALSSVRAELESAALRAGSDSSSNPQVMTAQVQLEQTQLNRSFATVVAPADGVVTNLRLAPGQFINAGTAALTFIERDSRWVVVDMRENQLTSVQVGDEADVLFDAAPGRTFAGRVRGIAWGIDPGRTAANGLPQNQSMTRWFEPARTIPVHIELLDLEAWPDNVRVGSMASAIIFAQGRDNPLAVAASFVQTASSYLSYLY